jgi:23S rRNA (cytosine1962-C5)-methyltransferase
MPTRKAKPAAPAHPIDNAEPLPAAHESPSGDAPRSGAIAAVTRRAAERVRNGHPWVYASDIVERIPPAGDAAIAPGSVVTVAQTQGALLGSALYSSTSQIALRMVSDGILAGREEFLALIEERLRGAIGWRQQWLANPPDTDACRLVFSEADALPGIMLDRYGDLVILQLLTQATGQPDVRALVARVVRQMLNPAALVERIDPRIRELEHLPAPAASPLYARDPESPQIVTQFRLNGLRFHYDANSGQKTGAFLDQRENYRAAEQYAHGRGLDVCTYQGGFALHLARRCAQVTGVDVSRAALEVAERNLEANHADLAADGGIAWIEANAFDLLRDWSDSGEMFDTIVLDPPAFAKSKRAVEGAVRGYKELNLRALKMLRPGGTLVTCSCSHHVSLPDFQAAVASAAADAKRRVRLLEVRGAALDHPAILTVPETQYLKCLICEVA